jgi:hypothetical protein
MTHTDYSSTADVYAHPNEYKAEDIDADIRDAEQLSWHQKRVAQTVRDHLLYDEGAALARLVLMYHDCYATLTDKMSSDARQRFDAALLRADAALKAMAQAWCDKDTRAG